jgi:hypothetical protein
MVQDQFLLTQCTSCPVFSKKGGADKQGRPLKIKSDHLPSVLSRRYTKPAMCGISFAVVIVHSITINCLMNRQEVKKNEAKTSMG